MADELMRLAERLWHEKRSKLGLAPAPFPRERRDFIELARTQPKGGE